MALWGVDNQEETVLGVRDGKEERMTGAKFVATFSRGCNSSFLRRSTRRRTHSLV